MDRMARYCLETITPNLVSLYFGFPQKVSHKNNTTSIMQKDMRSKICRLKDDRELNKQNMWKYCSHVILMKAQ